MNSECQGMKAIVYRGFGSPAILKYEEIAKPTPANDEVLIRVRTASLNPVDWRLMRGGPLLVRMLFSSRAPKIKQPGVDVAGEVEAVGKEVTQFKPGDAVFGLCRGAFSEYACAHPSKLALKPAQVSFEQAASIPVAALTALQGLRDKGQLQPGQEVLVNGASGGVGTFAVQLAKHLGARVTAVCSTQNLEMVRSLGADEVIDYTRQDFTRNGRRYDVILDCVGNHSAWACRRALNPQGICAIAGAPKEFRKILALMLQAFLLPRFVRQKFVMYLAKMNQPDLNLIADLIARGKVTPVIDRRYRLNHVPEAVAYLEQGHARGKVIMTLENGSAEQKAAGRTDTALAEEPKWARN
nr:L-threonine 3-dehydrogenase [uncultured bacterium]